MTALPTVNDPARSSDSSSEARHRRPAVWDRAVRLSDRSPASLLARVRDAQLRAAMAGRVEASRRYAALASRLGWPQWGTPKTGLATLGLAAALTLSAPVWSTAQPATPVRVAAAQAEVVADHQRVTGSLRAVSRSDVAAEEAGAIATVVIDEGDTVVAGTVVATIDDARHEARLAEAEAEFTSYQAQVAEREAELIQTQSDLAALDALAVRGAATDREHRDARTAVLVAEARLRSAQRQVESSARQAELARIRLQDLTVVAPFDGRVIRRHVEPGEWVDPGQPVVTLVSTGTIEARLEVPERFAAALNADGESLTIEVQTVAGISRSSEVRPVPEVDARARTFPVIVELDDRRGRLSPGMSVTASVPAGPAVERVTVPKDAVVRSAMGAHVFVATEEAGQTTAQRRDVRVLFTTGNRVALASGDVEPGERVVIEGNERLRPGATLVLIDEPEGDTRLALKY